MHVKNLRISKIVDLASNNLAILQLLALLIQTCAMNLILASIILKLRTNRQEYFLHNLITIK